MPSSPYAISLSEASRGELESLPARDGAVPDGHAGADRAARGRRRGELRDRGPAGNLRGHGPQVAAPVLRAGPGRAGRRPRPGRPRKFPARVVAEVKALACELPAASGTPLARWTCPELARHAAASGIVAAVSASTVRRWLANDALKPWQHRSWIFPRDPHFALKAGRVLDLYQRTWEGEPLSADEYVLSADEKPGVQARMRTHLPLPPGPGRAMRAESEYARCGTLAYLAAYDVHRARVLGRCEPSTGIKPFTALVDQVMSAEPYASARRVFWVVDNGASHRNWAAAARLRDADPNTQMVHLPVHASWLNCASMRFNQDELVGV